MPTIKSIAKYWIENTKISELDLMFDWADAEFHCWNCGLETTRLEKCHIIPRMLKGDGRKSSNYVLMCNRCHCEAPNLRSIDAMWEWIKDNKIKAGFFSFASFRMGLAIERFGYEKFMNLGIKYPKKFMELLTYKLKNDIGLHKTNITDSTYDYLFIELENELENEL